MAPAGGGREAAGEEQSGWLRSAGWSAVPDGLRSGARGSGRIAARRRLDYKAAGEEVVRWSW